MDLSPFVISGAPYLAALAAGLFSAGHCAGMCGPVTAALHLAAFPPDAPGTSARSAFGFHAGFNAGRLLTYTSGGALAGWLGQHAAEALSEWRGWLVLRTAAALLMLAAGLHVAGAWRGLARLERAGAAVLRLAGGAGRLRGGRPGRARTLVLGAAWGLVPCGLVYTSLVLSLAAGNALAGAGFMLCFGLGTLPAVMGVGLAAPQLGSLLRERSAQRVCGAFVAITGVWLLVFTLLVQPDVGLGCITPP